MLDLQFRLDNTGTITWEANILPVQSLEPWALWTSRPFMKPVETFLTLHIIAILWISPKTIEIQIVHRIIWLHSSKQRGSR